MEVLHFTLFVGDDKEVESIISVLLDGLPVLVVEVVVNPHESLVDHLGLDLLLNLSNFSLGELNLLASTHPVEVNLAVCWRLLVGGLINAKFHLLLGLLEAAEEATVSEGVEVLSLMKRQSFEHQLKLHKFKLKLVHALLVDNLLVLLRQLVLVLEHSQELLVEPGVPLLVSETTLALVEEAFEVLGQGSTEVSQVIDFHRVLPRWLAAAVELVLQSRDEVELLVHFEL
mmetsp:Transcript_31265/g.47849  ORF Transcript_31265/g.47849 Transcript_31265/m.47849 type:complete len:229 (-) Transcript_31265:2554-3240(-)